MNKTMIDTDDNICTDLCPKTGGEHMLVPAASHFVLATGSWMCVATIVVEQA